MSETRRQDPLRRTPPTIDLKAEVVPPKGEVPSAATEEGATAVEPVASTGLGPDPFPKTATGSDGKKAGAPDAPKTAAAAAGAPKGAPAEPAKSAAAAPVGSNPGTTGPVDPKPGTSGPIDPKPGTSGSVDPKPGTSGSAVPKSGAAGVGDAKAASGPDGKSSPSGSAASATASAPKAADAPKSDEKGPPGPRSDDKAKDSAKVGSAAAAAGAAASAASASQSPGSASAAATASPLSKPTASTPSSGPAVKVDAGASAGKGTEPGTEPVSPAATAKPSASDKPAATVPAEPSRAASAAGKPAAEREASRQGGGAGAVLTAGFVGGLLGAALAVGATRFLPVDRTAEDRIAVLERRVAALPTGPGPLEPRVVALEAGLKQAAEEARAAARQAAEALNRPAAGPSGGPDPEARSGLQALTARVEDGAARTAATGAALGDLAQKLDGLAKSSADRLTAIGKDVETIVVHQKSLQADVATLRSGTATLDSRAGEADKRIATLTDGLGRVSTDLARLSPAALQAGLRVVVSGRLDEALRYGAPVGPALSALAKLGTDAPTLAPLKPFAEAPAPSPAALLAEFKPLAAAILTAPPRPDESWLDKGRRILGKIVTVQAIGDGSGEDVPGLVGRIESSLGRGAVADAKAAWDKLPEEKRRLSAAWGTKLAARAAAEDAARRIGAQSLAALDAATR